MSADVLERVEGLDGRRGVAFHCPGCQDYHVAWIAAPAGGPVWGFSGDYVRPTLSPSLLVTWQYGEERQPRRCHSFIRDGSIEFLSDCTHALAGRTVPLPPIPEGGA